MEYDASLLQMLARVGFFASQHGHVEEGQTIFEALRAVRPEHECPILGMASVYMAKGQNEHARELLDKELLHKKPEHAQGRTYKGMSLFLEGRHDEAKPLLQAVVDKNDDPDAVGLAKGLLEGMN